MLTRGAGRVGPAAHCRLQNVPSRGMIGLRAYVPNAITNGPIRFSFEDYLVAQPQAAGTAALAEPAVLAAPANPAKAK